ncbi:copper amine oxidase N-terminal domain-containing protein [Calidifontibacillus erzurumensis]|uniref:Copper amine oxidase N-terminal domain-containing protein n=1 Tax=Calidifontibacillus erzurumensis TaxID=2741433 RepID=A0A8J8GIM9_9BACI|nr:copper amine oxidase N-terminal domain-containing protein [Calidifontibacillus erzurumensis]NSL52441.1 copper amine oxidase N-terminal domain-containing protein [Calidifontibacillus erzurumensis]
MKRNKITLITAATLLTGPLLFSSPASAQDNLTNELIKPISAVEENDQQAQIETSNFIKVSGIITKIDKESGLPKLIVEHTDKTLETHFPISDEVLIYDSHTTERQKKEYLQEGQRIDVYYDKHKPILMIYPAIIPPEIVIVKDEKNPGEVKVALFDENFVSLDNELKLNIDENTVLMNQKGENIKIEDLKDKELIVFYKGTTKSIPAQTTPTKIIALDMKDENNQGETPLEKVEQIIKEDHRIKNGVKMIPLRKIAEYLGYEVKWIEKISEVQISKENQSIQISPRKNDYKYNGRTLEFKLQPEINQGKIYVSEDILEILR